MTPIIFTAIYIRVLQIKPVKEDDHNAIYFFLILQYVLLYLTIMKTKCKTMHQTIQKREEYHNDHHLRSITSNFNLGFMYTSVHCLYIGPPSAGCSCEWNPRRSQCLMTDMPPGVVNRNMPWVLLVQKPQITVSHKDVNTANVTNKSGWIAYLVLSFGAITIATASGNITWKGNLSSQLHQLVADWNHIQPYFLTSQFFTVNVLSA